jgi:hypothetical protein
MVSGVKISELPTGTDLSDAYVPFIKGGINYKGLAALFTNIVSGIGKETDVLSSSDLYNVDDFDPGYIFSIEDTESNAVAAGAPVSGLGDADPVFWSIFTIGTSEYKIQFAYSGQADIERVFYRFYENTTNLYWSPWYQFGNQKLPRFQQLFDPPNDGRTVNQNLVFLANQALNSSTTQIIESISEDFEQYSDGKVRYIGDRGALYMSIECGICGDNQLGGAMFMTVRPMRNRSIPDDLGFMSVFRGTNGETSPCPTFLVLVQKYDVITIAGEMITSGDDLDLRGWNLYGEFDSWVDPEDVMGAELFENPDITSTDGFTPDGNTSLAVNSEGDLVASADGAGASTFTADISGLTIGLKYRVLVGAKRGASGTGQQITSANWFSGFASTTIDTTSEDYFVFDVEATATSGTMTFTVDSASVAGGEELIISEYSIKEYL